MKHTLLALLATVTLVGCGSPSGVAPTPVAATPSPASAPFDAHFLDMLAESDRRALAMLETEQKSGTDPKVQKLAETLAHDNKVDLQEVQNWRRLWYPGVPPLDMASVKQDLGPVTLTTGNGEPVDKLFLREMSKHHEATLALFPAAQDRAEHSQLKERLRDMDGRLRRELAGMRDLLL